jgi:predicted secreted hydrolase
VWLENWQVEETASAGECPSGVSQPCWYRLSAAQEGVFLDLILQDSKGVILQGDEGYSQKGPEPGQASYYYSLTRLQAKGQVVINTETFDVSGLSWMDHEWSTSALSKEQEGWDWFSVQLDDGSELMVFQIRRADGTIDPFSSGTLVAANGETTPLKSEDFSITVTDTWTSPDSGATYPAKWIVSIPGDELELQITPHMEDQELNVSYDYWEGAVQIKGTRDGVPVSGNGYVELTGYSGPMGGEF